MTSNTPRSPWWRQALTLIVFITITAAAASAGAAFGPDQWYAALVKPAFNPPNWIFPVVWTPLYLTIAIAGALIWTRAPRSRAMALWCAQLVLNAAWTWLFFGRHNIGAALVDIAALWVTISALVLVAWKQPALRPAAILLVPYWAWVGFAAILNAEFWRLN